MRRFIAIAIGMYIALTGCQDVTVGYLLTEDAEYMVDSLVVRRELDPMLDANRIKNGNPWLSNPIEGVEGTAQIMVSIKAIKSSDGNADKLWEYLKVYGDGAFEVPLEHDIPVGRYLISLNFKNEGYSKDIDDCFTIIVK